ncbi:MAG: hypothetical protein AB7O37_03230 [Vicinamibacteria bacterium]
MPRGTLRGAAAALALGLAGTGLGLAVLQRPGPLLVNLGAGDEAFARGFREWERDGLLRSGETLFRWAEDGSRLELPIEVGSGGVSARLRLARFAAGPAEITLLLNGRVSDHWMQEPRGWSLRSVEFGPLKGRLSLQIRTPSPDGAAALDWVEILGVEGVRPARELRLGLAALASAPVVLALLLGPGAGLACGAALLLAAPAAVALDRLGGLVALAEAGVPLWLAALGLGLLLRLLARAWPDAVHDLRLALVPAAFAPVALLALSHPFFYYPDLDTHARFLAAIRADPWTALDPSDFQARTGAWTRTIAGQKVAFPYSPVFHLLVWPLAAGLGDARAIETGGVLAVVVTLVLAGVLGRSLGLGSAGVLAAQALLALGPVTSSRLTLALHPTLLGQALEALVAVHLVRRFGHLDGARDAGAAALVLLAAQLAYTGSLFNVAAVVLLFAALEAGLGEPRRALRLAAAWAIAAAVVLLVLYARFLPTFLRDVLPHAGTASDAVTPAGGGPLLRLRIFYGLALPLLALSGLLALPSQAGATRHAIRWLLAALAAGSLLLLGRYSLPSLLRDAKDVELLAVPIALAAALALERFSRRRPGGRLAAAAVLLALLAWGALGAADAYAARFFAAGR